MAEKKPEKGDKPEKAKKAAGGGGADEKKAPKAPKAAKGEAAAEAKAEKKPAAEPKGEKPAKAEKKGKREAAEAAPAEAPAAEAGARPAAEEPPPVPRLLDRYRNEVRPRLKEAFGYANDMAVPKIAKIVVSMGVGAAIQNPKRLEEAQKHLTQIAGQKAVQTKARVSIANFRLRAGQAVGAKVTLRRNRMYEFFDRLIAIAMPRIRDFRGMSPKGFDGRGNYSMGLTEQLVFPEVDADKMEFTQGMNITVCTTAKTDKEAHELLSSFGFPFRQ